MNIKPMGGGARLIAAETGSPISELAGGSTGSLAQTHAHSERQKSCGIGLCEAGLPAVSKLPCGGADGDEAACRDHLSANRPNVQANEGVHPTWPLWPASPSAVSLR